MATDDANSGYVIHSSGKAAEIVATELQLLIAEETYPLVVGPWARGGTPSAVDRQLGMAYGAGAIQALKKNKKGVMVSFIPPEIKFIPLADAINKIRTISADNEFLKIAESIGIVRWKGGELKMKTETNNLGEITGTVLNIQRYCSHDGSGTAQLFS